MMNFLSHFFSDISNFFNHLINDGFDWTTSTLSSSGAMLGIFGIVVVIGFLYWLIHDAT